MHPESIKYTAFKCRFGLFEYTVLMPFGLTNKPSIFSHYCDEYGKIFKTDAQNKERAAYLAIFKWLSPEIAEKIDVSRIRTGTALLDCES